MIKTRPHAWPSRRIILALALIAPAALAPLPSSLALAQTRPEAESPFTDLATVNRAIRAMTTLKASFAQTDARGNVQTGTLLLKQPGHIRFDYGAKSNLLIVADGKSLTLIDYEVQQVQRWPIRSSPLGALLDPTRDLTRYGKLIETGDPRIVSIEVRDPEHPEYGVLSLVFNRKASAPGGLELYGWLTKDAQGNRTTIRLSSLVYGAPIADNAFRWRDPRPNTRGPRG